MESKSPRILYYDIETVQSLVAVFQLKYNDFIDPSNIMQEGYCVCASWQWDGEDKIHAVSVLDNPKLYAKDPHNDLHVIQTLHKVLSEADVLVAHNGDNFDKKYVDARILVHGLKPLPPITSIDTYKVAKSGFRLMSNKLDYIGGLLGVGRKKPTTSGLWIRVLNGDRKAIKEMVEYNKQDVSLLKRVFLKLRPFVANHINRELFGKSGCPRCGSSHVQSRGVHRAISRVYRRFQCKGCGGWFRSVLNDKLTKTTVRTL